MKTEDRLLQGLPICGRGPSRTSREIAESVLWSLGLTPHDVRRIRARLEAPVQGAPRADSEYRAALRARLPRVWRFRAPTVRLLADECDGLEAELNAARQESARLSEELRTALAAIPGPPAPESAPAQSPPEAGHGRWAWIRGVSRCRHLFTEIEEDGRRCETSACGMWLLDRTAGDRRRLIEARATDRGVRTCNSCRAIEAGRATGGGGSVAGC